MTCKKRLKTISKRNKRWHSIKRNSMKRLKIIGADLPSIIETYTSEFILLLLSLQNLNTPPIYENDGIIWPRISWQFVTAFKRKKKKFCPPLDIAINASATVGNQNFLWLLLKVLQRMCPKWALCLNDKKLSIVSHVHAQLILWPQPLSYVVWFSISISWKLRTRMVLRFQKRRTKFGQKSLSSIFLEKIESHKLGF